VDGECQPAAHSKNGSEQIRAGPQVSDGPQEFLRMTLFLQRIGGVGRSDEFDPRSAHFPFLSLSRRGDQRPVDHDGSAGGHVLELAGAGHPGIDDDCRLARQEPSLSSRKEKPLASRRVRTQPLTVTCSFASVAARTCLINVRIQMVRPAPLGQELNRTRVWRVFGFAATILCRSLVADRMNRRDRIKRSIEQEGQDRRQLLLSDQRPVLHACPPAAGGRVA